MITQSVWSWDFSDDALFVDESFGMDQDLRTALVINGWTRNSFLAAGSAASWGSDFAAT